MPGWLIWSHSFLNNGIAFATLQSVGTIVESMEFWKMKSFVLGSSSNDLSPLILINLSNTHFLLKLLFFLTYSHQTCNPPLFPLLSIHISVFNCSLLVSASCIQLKNFRTKLSLFLDLTDQFGNFYIFRHLRNIEKVQNMTLHVLVLLVGNS